jgi:hypothetical protein
MVKSHKYYCTTREDKKMRSINKSAKTNGGLVALMAILVIGLLGVGYLAVTQNIAKTPSGGQTDPTSCADSTGILTVNAINALERGSAISAPTITAGVNGNSVSTNVTSGTSTFAVGQKVTVLVSKADYIDQSFEFVMPCGGKVLESALFKASSTNPSVRIKNDDDDFMTDAVAGGAVNQTAVASGETVGLKVEFKGVNNENTGDLIFVVELPANTASNVTDILMPGATKVNLPGVHTTLNAGSKVQAFRVPAIEGAVSKTYDLSIVLGSGKIIAGGVYTDWYAEQEFVDTDGTIKKGVENSDSVAKYENSGDFDFYINA